MDKPKKGQTVFLLSVQSYHDRNSVIHEPRTAVITSVGPKYITVESSSARCGWIYKFDKNYPYWQKTEYSPTEMLFFSREDALNAQRKRIAFAKVKSIIGNRPFKDFTLSQLDRINSILDERIVNDGMPDTW